MDNYEFGYCNERVARGICKQQAWYNEKTQEANKCYYHDKVQNELCSTADDLVIYEEEDFGL